MIEKSISPIGGLIKEKIKKFAFKHTTLGAPGYSYCIEPIQLATLINEFERTSSIRGSLVEIGVARGMTTRFMCEHIVRQGLDKTTEYFAIDTFNSFLGSDIDHEVSVRGKSRDDLGGFGYNDYGVWVRNFASFPFVKALQADCSSFDYTTIAPIRMAFLDVDLYLPTRGALPKLWECLQEGGVIAVDDVQDNSVYDGAFQAYMEFCSDNGLQPEIIGNRCGILRKA
jgi:Macrocin-O-methyltransferase (TylF)